MRRGIGTLLSIVGVGLVAITGFATDAIAQLPPTPPAATDTAPASTDDVPGSTDDVPESTDDVPASTDTVPVPTEATAMEGAGPLRPTVSPGGAFLRSVLVPGWGQAAYDANLRGAVYFAGQLGNAFMLAKTIGKLGEARSVEARRVEEVGAVVRDSLLAAAETDDALRQRYEEDPSLLERDVHAGVDADESVEGIRELVGSRRQQREDWIAWTLFWTLASGIDAFVNAHLSDFPAGIVAEPSGDGRVSMGLTLRLPRGR